MGNIDMKKIFDYNSNGNAEDFHYLCLAKDIPSGQSRGFSISNEKGTKIEIAVFNVDGRYYGISNTCQHKGGPLSKGLLEGKIVTCPWHGWKYSVVDGKSSHKGGDSVNSYEIKIFDNKIYANAIPTNVGYRVTEPHTAYAELEKSVKEYLSHMDVDKRLEVPILKKIKVLGISTTNANDKVAPRKSTSEKALLYALDYAKRKLCAETIMIKLRDLNFKHCEGYYSKNSKACIFPCSISEMDKEDQMIEIYRQVIIWADVVIIATPIRWGSASSLYYQMVQRMNCVQNQAITHDTYLIRDKVAAFIVTGGQDNIQHISGELMTFWSQLGFVFGKFPFVGWSRGWYAEDTENNYDKMQNSQQINQDIEKTIRSAVQMSRLVIENRYDECILNR
jgi:nitrite reductase/ring-hydroxylating ferredoxin subunit/multimeric flavodoxin WrbA